MPDPEYQMDVNDGAQIGLAISGDDAVTLVSDDVGLFPVSINGDDPIDLSVSDSDQIQFDFAIGGVSGEHYAGTTEITPDGSDHTLLTAGMVVDEDIVIHKIPSNYGLITWDGSTLMVS